MPLPCDGLLVRACVFKCSGAIPSVLRNKKPIYKIHFRTDICRLICRKYFLRIDSQLLKPQNQEEAPPSDVVPHGESNRRTLVAAIAQWHLAPATPAITKSPCLDFQPRSRFGHWGNGKAGPCSVSCNPGSGCWRIWVVVGSRFGRRRLRCGQGFFQFPNSFLQFLDSVAEQLFLRIFRSRGICHGCNSQIRLSHCRIVGWDRCCHRG